LVAAPAVPAAPAAPPAPKVERAAAAEPAPKLLEPRPDNASSLSEIEQLADDLRGAGAAARKVTILGTASGEGITLTALTLARRMARDSRVLLIDLAASSSMILAASVDASVAGLAELMQGEATFSLIITRDRLSRVHLINAGRPGFDRTLLQSPRLALAIDALVRVYDHVLIDAGTASDLPAELLTTNARAVVVPEPSMEEEARALMCEQLRAVGFSEVTMLSKPAAASNEVEPGPRVVAA
jgi:Mrp family chromosome partitioning ATPase